MSAPKDFSDLDMLLARAQARQTPHKERRKRDAMLDPKELSEAERRVKARFLDPQNWERVRTVALIHCRADGIETLLGNFVEYKHRLSKGVCRKLIRVNEPQEVHDFEYVEGEHWLKMPDEHPVKVAGVLAEEQREAIIDIHLPELGHLFSPDVIVSVHLRWGGIARVELTEDTRFFDKDRREFCELPAGLDVLEAMSAENKAALREFLAEEERSDG